MRKLVYRVVSFRQHRITGWVFDENDPAHRLTIDLTIDGKVVGSTLANVIRRDLDKALHPDRLVGYHSFLPLELWTGQTYELAIVVRETGTVLASQRIKTTDHRIAGAPSPLQGQVTEAGAQGIAGWVADGRGPLEITVSMDGIPIHRGLADAELHMVGLLPAGFSVRFPAAFFDGQPHRAAVHVLTPDGPFEIGAETITLAVEDKPGVDFAIDLVVPGRIAGTAIDPRQPNVAQTLIFSTRDGEIGQAAAAPETGGSFEFSWPDSGLDLLGNDLSIRTGLGIALDLDWAKQVRAATKVMAIRQPDGALDLILASALPMAEVVQLHLSAPGFEIMADLKAPATDAARRVARLRSVPASLGPLRIRAGLLDQEVEVLSSAHLPATAGDFLSPDHPRVLRHLAVRGDAVPAGAPTASGFTGAWTLSPEGRIDGWAIRLGDGSSQIVQVNLDGQAVALVLADQPVSTGPAAGLSCGFGFNLLSTHRRGTCLVSVGLGAAAPLPPVEPVPVVLRDAPEDFLALPALKAAQSRIARRPSDGKSPPHLDAGQAESFARLLLGSPDKEGLEGLTPRAALGRWLRDDRFLTVILPALADPATELAHPSPEAATFADDASLAASLLPLPDEIRQAVLEATDRRGVLSALVAHRPLIAALLGTGHLEDIVLFQAMTAPAGIGDVAAAWLDAEGQLHLTGLAAAPKGGAIALELYDRQSAPLARLWPALGAEATGLVCPLPDLEADDIGFVAFAPLAEGDDASSWTVLPLSPRLPAADLAAAQPTDLHAQLHLLRQYRDQGRYAEGLAQAASVARAFRGDYRFHGLCLTLLRKWLDEVAGTPEAAVQGEFLADLQSAAPALLEAFQHEVKRLADRFTAVKLYDGGIALLQPFLAYLDNDNRSLLAAMLRAARRLEDARQLANQALAANPGDLRAIRVLRDIALDERNFGEAFHLGATALHRQPNFENTLAQARIYVALANNGYGAGHYLNPIPPAHAYAAGVQLLEQVVKDFPRDHRGWWTLGQIYQAAGRLDLALKAVAQAHKLRPTDGHAMGLARLHMRLGQIAEAAEACRLALARNPDNAGAIYALKFIEGPGFRDMVAGTVQPVAAAVFDRSGIDFTEMVAALKQQFDLDLRVLPLAGPAQEAPIQEMVQACRAAPQDWFILPVGGAAVIDDFAALVAAERDHVGAVFSAIAVGHFERQAFVRGELLAEILEAFPPKAQASDWLPSLARHVRDEARRLLRNNLPAAETPRAKSVAIVSRHGWLGFGGAEQFMRNIAKAYADAGNEVWIVGMTPGMADQQGLEDGIHWCFVEDEAGLRRLLRARAFGVVHATGLVYSVAKAASLLNITVVYGFHFYRDLIESQTADDGYYPRVTDAWPARPEGRALMQDLSTIYANSQFSRRLIEKKFRVRVPVIYSTSYDEPRMAEGEGDVILLMNARADKGFNLLMDMAARLPHRRFIAVANQSSAQMAERWLAMRSLSNVTILNRTDDIDALYRQARVVIVPSFEFVETFSRVVIEAQLRGRVVIGADAGNIPYLLAESGFLLPEDAGLWAETAERLFTDDAAHDQARRLALANTARFSPAVFRTQAARVIAGLGKRVLVGVGSGIGNVIHVTPMLRLMARHFGAPVDVVFSEGGINYFDVLDRPDVVGTIMEMGTLAVSKRYDLVFLTNCFGDMTPGFNTPELVASRDHDRFVPGQSAHETLFNLDMAERLLGLSWQESDAHDYFFGDRDYSPPRSGIIAFHGGSKGGRWEAKRWPHYSQLAEALIKDGFRVVSVGIPEEHVPGTEDWTGGSIGEMADRLLGVDYLVSNDSGVMNIGNALGLPLTAIFAPTEAATRGPRRPQSRIVALQKDCSPCEVKDPARFNAGLCHCIGEITLDQVLATVREGLAAAGISRPEKPWA